MKTMAINSTQGIGESYESMKSVVSNTQENVGADSVLSSMKKMVPNWNFATNTQAQNTAETQKAAELKAAEQKAAEQPEKVEVDTDVVVQTKEPDGSWLV